MIVAPVNQNLEQKMGLNIGCGTDIRPDFVNLDRAALPGVDVVWELDRFPYPFEDNRFDRIILINVLEHLPDTVRVMEELHRISRPGALITIRVPYWNSIEQYTDPTHRRFFTERTFDYFDPGRSLGQRRSYYSEAKFKVHTVGVWLFLLVRFRYFTHPLVVKPILWIAHYLSNIVRLIEFELLAVKDKD